MAGTTLAALSGSPGHHNSVERDLPPAHAVARQHVTHGVDPPVLRHRELGGPLFPPFLIGRDGGGRLGAFDEVLHLHLAARLLVTALDDDARAAAAIGIFHLRAHPALAEVQLRADAGVAQRLHHALIIGDAIAVEHGDHHRPRLRLAVELAKMGKRRLQARYPDGESGGRDVLTAEAADEAVVASPTAHRAEARRLALLVDGLEQELNLVDR